MKTLFYEYGQMVIAILGAGLIIWAIAFLPAYWKEYLNVFVQAITGGAVMS